MKMIMTKMDSSLYVLYVAPQTALQCCGSGIFWPEPYPDPGYMDRWKLFVKFLAHWAKKIHVVKSWRKPIFYMGATS
jgi:hypothetical protein